MIPLGQFPHRLWKPRKSPPQIKQYAFGGVIGCVHSVQRNYKTKTPVSVYHAAQAGFETVEDEPWLTVCELHKKVIGNHGLSIARELATDPTSWCDECLITFNILKKKYKKPRKKRKPKLSKQNAVEQTNEIIRNTA